MTISEIANTLNPRKGEGEEGRKPPSSEFENETLSLSHPYFLCFVNATILESDVFNMCGISGALHPNEARVYVPA